ncbi:hypothetical protein HAX54_024764, partial [Datura stramonium]|nr:hypothetical protein [Datura stramonium]
EIPGFMKYLKDLMSKKRSVKNEIMDTADIVEDVVELKMEEECLSEVLPTIKVNCDIDDLK